MGERIRPRLASRSKQEANYERNGKIYEAFIAGELAIAPESVMSRAELAEYEKRLGLSAEQSEELRELILDIAGDYGKKMFKTGFALSQEHAVIPE